MGEHVMKKMNRDISTLKGLIDEYIEYYAKPQKSSWHEDLRVLNKDVLPKLKYLTVAEVTKGDVAKVLRQIMTLRSDAAARRTLKILQAMFSFAVTRGVLESNPCSDIAEPGEEVVKDRVLKENEVGKLWFGLDAAKMSKGIKLSIKLLLVTGQRSGEVAGAKWSEFELNEKLWTIPAERTKNKKNHRVFLTKLAIDILLEAKKLPGRSIWVFPSSRDGHITARSISAAIRNNSEKIPKGHPKHKPPYGDFFKIGHFFPSDIRRSMASLLKKLGVDEAHIAKAQNQAESDGTRKSKKAYDSEKRQALEAWEKKLQTIMFSWRNPSVNSDSRDGRNK
jgi:integrase